MVRNVGKLKSMSRGARGSALPDMSLGCSAWRCLKVFPFRTNISPEKMLEDREAITESDQSVGCASIFESGSNGTSGSLKERDFEVALSP
jgi:hypothetical protein